MARRTVGNGERAADEVVLHVDDDERRNRSHDLLDPIVPARDELVLAQFAVAADVENAEDVADHEVVDGVRFALLIAEKGLEKRGEFVDVQGVVPRDEVTLLYVLVNNLNHNIIT